MVPAMGVIIYYYCKEVTFPFNFTDPEGPYSRMGDLFSVGLYSWAVTYLTAYLASSM